MNKSPIGNKQTKGGRREAENNKLNEQNPTHF